MWRLMGALVFSLGMNSAALSQPALRDVPQLDDGLFVVGLADQIRKKCPDISARFFSAVSFLRNLEDEARALGYSRGQVEAHLKSDVEKNRLRKRAAAYMKLRGFQQDQEGYCALGRAEIDRKSQIGALLRLRK